MEDITLFTFFSNIIYFYAQVEFVQPEAKICHILGKELSVFQNTV
jgi:hypothetical protein